MKGSANRNVKDQEHAGENYSDVIPHITKGKEAAVLEFLRTIDPVMRSEIAEHVKSAKTEMDGW